MSLEATSRRGLGFKHLLTRIGQWVAPLLLAASTACGTLRPAESQQLSPERLEEIAKKDLTSVVQYVRKSLFYIQAQSVVKGENANKEEIQNLLNKMQQTLDMLDRLYPGQITSTREMLNDLKDDLQKDGIGHMELDISMEKFQERLEKHIKEQGIKKVPVEEMSERTQAIAKKLEDMGIHIQHGVRGKNVNEKSGTIIMIPYIHSNPLAPVQSTEGANLIAGSEQRVYGTLKKIIDAKLATLLMVESFDGKVTDEKKSQIKGRKLTPEQEKYLGPHERLLVEGTEATVVGIDEDDLLNAFLEIEMRERKALAALSTQRGHNEEEAIKIMAQQALHEYHRAVSGNRRTGVDNAFFAENGVRAMVGEKATTGIVVFGAGHEMDPNNRWEFNPLSISTFLAAYSDPGLEVLVLDCPEVFELEKSL